MNWQKIKLGDVVEKITKGTTPTTIGFDFENEGVNFVKVESIDNSGFFVKDSFAYISEKCHNALSRSQIQENDILFSIAGAIGRIALANKEILPANTNQALAIIRLKNESVIERKFLVFYLEYLVKSGYFAILMSGVAQKNVSLQQLRDLIIQVPGLETQENIVTILEKWDAAIENLKQQILEEEKVSKGLLNKTFPLYGNYNNLTKMIDVAIIEKGRALSAKQIVNGDYPVFAGGIESPYSHNDFTHENVITVSASGANAGYVAYRKGKIWASDCNVVKGDGVRTLTMFLYYWLKSRQRYIYSLQTGGAQPHVHASDIAKLQIEVPSINNQFKIINILGTQDQKLSLLRQKLANYEKQRKYLLNHLLSGKEDI